MASNTPNLQLYKADPVADGNDLFDIKKLLNENWDKIDTNSKNLLQKIDVLNSNVNLRSRVQVITYIGTGTYGENSPNRVTFDFPPKFVFCSGAVINTNRTGAFALFRDGALYGPVGWGGFYITWASFSGNSVSWYTYSSSNESGQANARDQKYTIIGIA